jgi:hypothetical protein
VEVGDELFRFSPGDVGQAQGQQSRIEGIRDNLGSVKYQLGDKVNALQLYRRAAPESTEPIEVAEPVY